MTFYSKWVATELVTAKEDTRGFKNKIMKSNKIGLTLDDQKQQLKYIKFGNFEIILVILGGLIIFGDINIFGYIT